MLRLCFRRKKAWVVLGSLCMVLATSLLFSTTPWYRPQNFDDYDLIYDTDHGIPDTRRVRDVFRSDTLNVDRRPQSQNMSPDPEQAEGPPKVIFNRDQIIFAKRLTFLPGSAADAENQIEEELGEDYDESDDEGDNHDENVNMLELGGDDDEEDEDDDVEDEYQYWKENPNPVFQLGDFDNYTTPKKPIFKFSIDADKTNNQRATKSKASSENTKDSLKANNCEYFRNCSQKSEKGLGLPHLQAKKVLQQTANSDVGYQGHDSHYQGQNLAGASQDQPESIQRAGQKRRGLSADDVDLPGVGQRLGFPDGIPATQLQRPAMTLLPDKVTSQHGFDVIQEGIYWSLAVEDFVPKGLSVADVNQFTSRSQRSRVLQMTPATWSHCGRLKNQYVILEDGTAVCARYRHPYDKLVQGEVMSFYLSRLIGLDNVPAVTLMKVNSSVISWRKVNISATQWQEGTTVAFIQWINDMEDINKSRVKMPAVILSAYESGIPFNSQHHSLVAMTMEELAELLQWGDMVLFDYITGNYDRVASMQDGAHKENRPSILSENIRNLRRSSKERKFWLIDNESGLLDSYELMYQGSKAGTRFIEFHTLMLRTLCIFHRTVAEQIEKLSAHPRPAEYLIEITEHYQPLFKQLPKSSNFKIFTSQFHSRLKDVSNWIKQCKHR